MLKQLVMAFAIFSLLGVLAIAQENPVKYKKEKKECAANCCSNHGSRVSMSMVHMDADSTHNMHHEMKMDDASTSNGKIWNKVCPVRGEEVDPEAPTVEYNGKVYGFCCPGCDAKFEKNPEKYSKNLNEDGTQFIGNK